MEERAPSPRPLPEDEDEELRALARLLSHEAGPRPWGADEDELLESEPRPSAHEPAQRAPAPRSAPRLSEPDSEWAPSALSGGTPVRKREDSPPSVAQRFDIQECLGDGPNGTVFRSRDQANQGREVALKILHRSDPSRTPGSKPMQERALLWLAATRGLTQNTVNRLRESGVTEDGRIWISSDLVEGESAQALFDRSGALPPRHAFEIVRQVLLGLEEAHAAGFVHGHLCAENVLLESGASWDDSNPFGVAVRLTDLGLASILDPRASSPEPEQDLLAASILLADLLSGERHASDASDWIGSEGSVGTSALSPAARRVLDRALARNPASRFGAARALRRAIELTPECNPPEARTGQGRLIALVVFAGVTTALAGWLMDRSTEAQAASGDTAPLGIAAGSPSVPSASIEGESASPHEDPLLDADRNAGPDDAAAAPEELTVQGSAAGAIPSDAAQPEGPSSTGSSTDLLEPESPDATANPEALLLASDLERSHAKIENLERESAANAQRATAMAEELELARTEIETLRSTPATTSASTDPRQAATLSALFVDRWFEHLSQGDLDGGRAVAQSFQDEASLAQANIAGGDFLEEALDALEALDGLGAEQDPMIRLELLPIAWRAVSRTEATGLRVIAAQPVWGRAESAAPAAIDESGSPLGPQRMQRVSDLIDGLVDRFGQLESEVDRELELHWDQALAEPLRDVDEVLLLAEHFDDQRLPVFVERFAERAHQLAGSDVRLDPRVLTELEPLGAWARLLDSGSIEADWEDAQTILELNFARTFALGGGALEGGRVPVPPDRLSRWEPDGSWRERLVLRTRLLDDEVGLPGRVGARYLHFGRTVEGEESWRWDAVRADPNPPADADASRIVDQRFYDNRGAFLMERSLRVFRIGMRIFEEDAQRSPILDLANLDIPFEARSWKPGPTPPPPARLFVPADGPALFAHRMGEERRRCLVLPIGSARTWWSPELGQVRHSDTDRITRELVYAELPD